MNNKDPFIWKVCGGGGGNLNYKVGTDAKDEIGQLTKAFDQMTAGLKSSTASRDELSKEIAERTKTEDELKKKNEQMAAFNKITSDRELKMIELKKEINSLLKESGREPRYTIFEERTIEEIK